MIKRQTIDDYHNHIIHLINRKIEELECGASMVVDEYSRDEFYKRKRAIRELKDLRDTIYFDYRSSTYWKCTHGEHLDE